MEPLCTQQRAARHASTLNTRPCRMKLSSSTRFLPKLLPKILLPEEWMVRIVYQYHTAILHVRRPSWLTLFSPSKASPNTCPSLHEGSPLLGGANCYQQPAAACRFFVVLDDLKAVETNRANAISIHNRIVPVVLESPEATSPLARCWYTEWDDTSNATSIVWE